MHTHGDFWRNKLFAPKKRKAPLAADRPSTPNSEEYITTYQSGGAAATFNIAVRPQDTRRMCYSTETETRNGEMRSKCLSGVKKGRAADIG